LLALSDAENVPGLFGAVPEKLRPEAFAHDGGDTV
jgi:hypothetical protein